MADLLPADAEATVTRVLRVAYPHPSFPDGPYERTAATILTGVRANLRLTAEFAQGLRDLDAAAGGRFADLSDGDALPVLEAIADAGFFASIRATAITTLYDDREVWELLGYQGASFDQGGYLTRGFDDLDWLPAASVDRATDLAEEKETAR